MNGRGRMDIQVFEKIVEREVANLDSSGILRFVWLCAVRALPFLGMHGNFHYWKDCAEMHLSNVLHAVDYIANNAFYSDDAAELGQAAWEYVSQFINR